ncbi:MAG TPA: MucB/RseB C-terminal domain-containing protein [Casimicrobiaceae bacterium]|nr:MucB/RseB C-terminal domain-containing protein [Casimicrobiaceae bacterium]
MQRFSLSRSLVLVPRRAPFAPLAAVVSFLAALAYGPVLRAEDATAWLSRAAQAAKSLNYVGTIVFQYAGRVETSRLIHVNDNGTELEKLVNLDGPAREVIRSHGEVRCYYPDAKIVRIEPRTFRNVFPSISREQQQALEKFYEFRKAEAARVAGLDTQAYVLEPRDGLRYGHKFWADKETGLLLKARLVNEKGDIVEQFAFSEITINARIDRDAVKPSWGPTPPDWQVRQGTPGDAVPHDTGWVVTRLPPGFHKTMEGFRTLRGKREAVAHLVFSDGLVAVSVFVEPLHSAPGHVAGVLRQGALNVFALKLDDHLITVLGEVPIVTVRQIAQSVTKQKPAN